MVEYLAHFNEKVREHKKLCKTDEQFTDQQLVNMLNNAITRVPGGQEVHNNHCVAAKTAAGIVGGGRAVTTITYAELLEALMHQAQIIDEAPNRSKSASGFSANQHLIAFEDQEELVPYDLEEEDVVQANVYNINTPMEKLGHWKNHSNGRHKGYNVYNVRLKTGR